MPLRTGSRPTRALNRVDLPAPLGPTIGHLGAVRDAERHVVEGRAPVVGDGDVRRARRLAAAVAHRRVPTLT